MPDPTPSVLPTIPWVPSPELAPHLEGLRAGRIVLPRCTACDAVIWFPRAFCPHCGGSDVSWFEASGEGTVYSFTIVRRGLGAFAESSPYSIAYVELKEGPRVLTNIVGPLDDLEIGAGVVAVIDDAEDPTLRFRLTGEGAA